jgi:hypothetical protein
MSRVGEKEIVPAYEHFESVDRHASLVATGQIKLRRIDGWQKIAPVLSQNTSVAA